MFENRVLRRIFGPKRNGVTGRVEKTSPNVIRIIKSKGVKLTGKWWETIEWLHNWWPLE
jgi:hypothetical protein